MTLSKDDRLFLESILALPRLSSSTVEEYLNIYDDENEKPLKVLSQNLLMILKNLVTHHNDPASPYSIMFKHGLMDLAQHEFEDTLLIQLKQCADRRLVKDDWELSKNLPRKDKKRKRKEIESRASIAYYDIYDLYHRLFL